MRRSCNSVVSALLVLGCAVTAFGYSTCGLQVRTTGEDAQVAEPIPYLAQLL